PGESNELCGNAVLTEDDDMDTIVVVGRRPARHVYFRQSHVDTSPGPQPVRLVGRGAGGFLGNYVRLGNMMINAQQLAKLAAQVHNLTIQWGLNDIERFRATGLHVTSPPGSVIPWHTAKVDWNEYGADNPNLSAEQVLQNLIDSLNQP